MLAKNRHNRSTRYIPHLRPLTAFPPVPPSPTPMTSCAVRRVGTNGEEPGKRAAGNRDVRPFGPFGHSPPLEGMRRLAALGRRADVARPRLAVQGARR